MDKSKIEYNIYCDESCYLENDHKKYMIMGALKCPKSYRKKISKDIRNIKNMNGINEYQEIKWTKINKLKEQLYIQLIDYFFDNPNLSFRAIIIDKSKLKHREFKQTHEDFYYKMYYELLCRAVIPQKANYIYLDIKDTKSSVKIRKLKKCLNNGSYDFDNKYIKRVQSIDSKESELIQLCDIFIGAIGFLNRNENHKENYSITKNNIVNHIIEKSGYNLTKTTFLSEEKFNLFFVGLK